ncbi:MAG: sulfite exporter TauE/SafE family protein [Proteobacteria bacterium]|nr:sulfite exporter TauE/SafE family protein [Pseudomonadota bacterium]
MCGGIAAALNLGSAKGPAITVAYHMGRISSYTILGGALGFAAGTVEIQAWTMALRYIAGFLLLGMGLYIADWWRGMAQLEHLGAKLWQPVQKFSSRYLPIHHWSQALALGLCWGLMPCGLIYSSLAWAVTSQSGIQSAALMLCFGLGTLPAMLATSFGAGNVQRFLRRKGLKIFIALFLITSGLWTLYMTYSHGNHSSANMSEHSGHTK